MPIVGKVITLGPLPEPANPEIGYTSCELFQIPGFQEMLHELFKFPLDLGSVAWGISCASPEDLPHITVEYIPVQIKNCWKKILEKPKEEELVILYPSQDQLAKELDASLHNRPK